MGAGVFVGIDVAVGWDDGVTWATPQETTQPVELVTASDSATGQPTLTWSSPVPLQNTSQSRLLTTVCLRVPPEQKTLSFLPLTRLTSPESRYPEVPTRFTVRLPDVGVGVGVLVGVGLVPAGGVGVGVLVGVGLAALVGDGVGPETVPSSWIIIEFCT